jgi:hypothetical protein
MVAVHPLPPVGSAQPDSLVITSERLRAARAGWPQAEPDSSVWRILSCARADERELTDEQLHAALPAFSMEEVAAARSRVAGLIADVAADPPLSLADMLAGPPITLDELIAGPSITLDEAIACGLLDDPTAEPACASST